MNIVFLLFVRLFAKKKLNEVNIKKEKIACLQTKCVDNSADRDHLPSQILTSWANNEQHVFLKVKSDFFSVLFLFGFIFLGGAKSFSSRFISGSFLPVSLGDHFYSNELFILMSSEIILFYASFSTPRGCNRVFFLLELDALQRCILFSNLVGVCVIRYLYSTRLSII